MRSSVLTPRPLSMALAVLALAVVLYPGALIRGEIFFERDLHHDWYPRLAALGRVLRAGGWPLWEPGLGFGQPLLADPSVQVLYPATWLALALPWNLAYTAIVLAHLLIAGLGAARLAARLGAGHLGAWAAGLGFVLTGPVQSSINLWHHFAGTAWMPWVLLAVDAAVRRPGVATALPLAAAFALQILAGSADLCAMTLVVSAWLAVARLAAARRRKGHVGPALAACLAALALSAALTCALWWPAAEVLSRSSRRALPEEVRSAWSVPAAGLARFVAPLDPARVPYEPTRWTSLYDRPSHPLLFSLYLGPPLVGLASLALLDRRRRGRALLIAGVAIATVVFAMGPHGPLYGPLARLVPGLASFRYPSKALIPAALLMALAAGLGVRALAGAARGRLLVAALVLGGCAAAIVVSRAVQAETSWTLVVGLVFALVLALRGSRVNPAFTRVALVTMAVLDLVAAHRDLNATAPVGLLLEAPPVVAALRVDEGRRVHVWDYYTLPDDAERLLGRVPSGPRAGPTGLDHRILEAAAQRQVLVGATAAFFGLETSYDYDSRGLYQRDLNDLVHLLRRAEGTPAYARLLRMGAVARLAALHERGLEELPLERSLPSLLGDPIRVYAVPGAQPRARLVGRTRRAEGEAAVRALLDPGFDPGVEAIVATGVPLESEALPAGSVRWLERRADRQRLETDSPRPGLLVLADAYDPGWRARVDAAPAEVVRANLAFRAVPVPEGRHIVELLYRPASVLWGLGVSLGTLLVMAGLVLVQRRHASLRRTSRA